MWRNFEIASGVITTFLCLMFWIQGFFTGNEEAQQWSLILALTAYVLILGEREFRRGKIIGPKQEGDARELMIRIISRAQDFLKIMDNYPGEETLRVISIAPEEVPVKLLTSNVIGENNPLALIRFESLAFEMMSARPELEIRYAPKGTFHGRYLLTKPFGWNIDYSLKDAGKKDTRFSDMSREETKEQIDRFDEYWETATPLVKVIEEERK